MLDEQLVGEFIHLPWLDNRYQLTTAIVRIKPEQKKDSVEEEVKGGAVRSKQELNGGGPIDVIYI